MSYSVFGAKLRNPVGTAEQLREIAKERERIVKERKRIAKER
jgi:hypothetical protein